MANKREYFHESKILIDREIFHRWFEQYSMNFENAGQSLNEQSFYFKIATAFPTIENPIFHDPVTEGFLVASYS